MNTKLNPVILLETEILSVEDIQEVLQVGKNSAYDLVKKAYENKSPFPVIKIGRLYRVPKQKFMDWIRNGDS